MQTTDRDHRAIRAAWIASRPNAKVRPLFIHLEPNIPAGGKPLAGCAPFARRGETKDLREALNLQTAPARAVVRTSDATA